MELILSRHGNTFGPTDPVVWTGATNDIPLVEKGIEQAKKFGDALHAQGIQPDAVYCGPLQRTRSYAATLVEKLALPLTPKIDPRLNEVDYGSWTGLTQQEVASKFGLDSLKGWDERCEWPKNGDWKSSPEAVFKEVQSFIEMIARTHAADSKVIVVTSNGRLRYFLKLVETEFKKRIEDGSFKVKTGHICKLSGIPEHLEVKFWNKEPGSVKI